MEHGDIIAIIGIVIGAPVTIGVAVYHGKVVRQKAPITRRTNSHQNVWNALLWLRAYYESGMQTELKLIGTLKLEPIYRFRNAVMESKDKIKPSLYKDLSNFYKSIAEDTNKVLLEPMQMFFERKNELSANEKNEIEAQVNKERVEIVKRIEKFMDKKKKELE